jgi:hypothetical protein
MAARCTSKNAPKVIWSIQGNAKFNSDCALALREGFRQGKIRLLISEFEADEVLKEMKGYNNLLPSEKIKFQLPYIQTSLLINELINLEYQTKDNLVKVHETSGNRKDRFSSLEYNFFVSTAIELKSRKPKQQQNVSTTVVFRPPKIRS